MSEHPIESGVAAERAVDTEPEPEPTSPGGEPSAPAEPAEPTEPETQPAS